MNDVNRLNYRGSLDRYIDVFFDEMNRNRIGRYFLDLLLVPTYFVIVGINIWNNLVSREH